MYIRCSPLIVHCLETLNLLSFCRRVELVLLHSPESEPKGTISWLKSRPHLARHHHARLSHPKVRPQFKSHSSFNLHTLQQDLTWLVGRCLAP